MAGSLLIVANPRPTPSSRTFLSKICMLSSACHDDVTVIGTGVPPDCPGATYVSVNVMCTGDVKDHQIPMNIICEALAHLSLTWHIMRHRSELEFDKVLFLTPAPLEIIVARVIYPRVVLYSGGFPFFPTKRLLKSRAESFFLKYLPSLLVDRIILESKGEGSFYRAGEFDSKCVLCPQYVDTNLFRRHVPITDREFDVAFFGKLSKQKGVDRLLVALRGLLRESRPLKILFVGEGPLKKEVEELADEFSTVRIMPWTDWRKLPELLNQTKYTIVPSDYEGLPNIVLESLACGTPVISTSVGGLADIIRDGTNGFLMAGSSPEQIRSALHRAAMVTDVRSLSENAVTTITGRYDFKSACSRFNHAISL